MSWKKISLSEAIKNDVGRCFSDYDGEVIVHKSNLLHVNGLPLTSLYLKNADDEYVQVNDFSTIDFTSVVLYQKQNGYGYRTNNSYVEVRKPYRVYFQNRVINIPPDNPNIDVWVCDAVWSLTEIARQYDIKLGDKIFYNGKIRGVCEVVKVYDYPDDFNRLIRVKRLFKIDATGEDEFDVKCGEYCLYFVPYEDKCNAESELNQFNERKNEFDLLPYVFKEGNVVNVQWRSVNAAARYIVELYRHVSQWPKPELYKLQSYEIDRNVCHLQIEALIGKGFIFRVIAEDREGNMVAKSRGIRESGEPIFW